MEEDKKRTARYSARRRSERGEVRVAVWVPADRTAELRQFAEKLRHGAGNFRQRTKKPPVVPPRVEIPVAPIEEWALVAIEPNELAFRLVLKANGAKWCSGSSAAYARYAKSWSGQLPSDGVWRIRADLVGRIGLGQRVVAVVDAAPSRRGSSGN